MSALAVRQGCRGSLTSCRTDESPEATLELLTARRTITLDDTTLAVLAGGRAHQSAEFAAVGIDSSEQWVFTDGDGKPVHPHAVYEAFRRIVHNEGVPAIRYHDLRHTHGSLLIRDGIPVKVVSERLGHANIAFTMQTYQHLLPGMQAEAAETALRIIVDGWYRAPLDAKAPERCGGPSLHRPLVVPTR